jgi:hypothetical protein
MKYLYKKREQRLLKEREENEAALQRALHLMELGVCADCEGKGCFELPIWGSLRCNTCAGTGKRY